MRDLKKILDFCAEEDTMDYCPEFDGIKSILEHVDKNVKPFKKLCFRSGNDSVVNDLVRRLQDFFAEMQLIDADTKQALPGSLPTFRKILVFLLANTDATYKYNMHDDAHIAHIYEICPLLPKFMTVTLVWELQLDNIFYEALAYSPCWFAFQFFEAACESLKFIEDAKKILVMLEEIIKSLLISIERSSCLQMDVVDQKIIFNKMHDQAIILLRRFNTPDARKLEKMKKSELKNYWGFCVKHLLQMVLFAFDLYESKANTEPQLDISIYKIGASFQKNQWTKKQLTEAIREEELKIINALLGTLQNCAMIISMDYFIEWVEVDLTPTLTLQQAIGEMAYKVRQRLNANASFEHGVDSVLATIEIRPRTLEQIVSEAKIGDILRALDDATVMTYEETKMWFDELFKRGTAALGNAECLEYIMDHTDLMTKENCVQVMECILLKKQCAMQLDDDEDSDDDGDEFYELKLLLQNAASQLKSKDLLELLDLRFKLFGEDTKALTPDPQELEQRITEFLNKCTTTFELNTFLELCIQDPVQMWSKFFASACQIKELVHNFRDTVMQTLPASLTFVDKVLKNGVQNHWNTVHFPKLFAELYFLIYKAAKADFLAKFLNGHIKTLLDEQNFESLLPILNALEIITAYDEKLHFEELTAPMLAMICNVAERGRWAPSAFSTARVEVVTTAINFIKQTLDRFLPVITEKDRKWLTSKVKTTSGPFTQYYFQRIFASGDKILSLDGFLLSDKEPLNDTTVAVFLKKTILRCNVDEFFNLMSNKSFHVHVPTTLLEIANDISQKEANEKAASNFRYCLSNYLNLVSNVLDDGSKDWPLLKSIFEIIAAAPKNYYEQIFMEAECLLQQLIKACAAKSKETNNATLKEIKEFVETKMQDCTAKEVFLKSDVFENQAK